MGDHVKKKMIGLILFLCCGIAQANSGWTDSNIIDVIRATTSGKFVVKASFGKNPSNCKDEESFYLNYSVDGADSIYLLLLQAIATQNEVKFYVTGRCELNGMSEISSAVILAK